MPGTQMPKIPEGLRDLMKSLTKEILREKPSNIYEFSAQFFERIIEKQQDFKVKEFEPISEYDFFKTRDRASISVALLYSIMPAGLTYLIKDFIKAVLKSRPENICAFGVEYFRRLQKINEHESCQIDYIAFESYFRGKEKFTFTPYVKCTCGRTLGGGMALNNNSVEKFQSNGQQNTVFSGFCGTKGCEKSLEIGERLNEKKVNELKYDEKTMKAIYIIQKYFRRHINKKKTILSKQKTSNETSLLTQELSVNENTKTILNKNNSSFEKPRNVKSIASTTFPSQESSELLSNEVTKSSKELDSSETVTEKLLSAENENEKTVENHEKHERQKRGIAENEILEIQNGSSIQAQNKNFEQKAEEAAQKEINIENLQTDNTNNLLSTNSVQETNQQVETLTKVIENTDKNIQGNESIENQSEILKNETKVKAKENSEKSLLLNSLEKIEKNTAEDLSSSTQEKKNCILDAEKLDKSSDLEPLLKSSNMKNITSLSQINNTSGEDSVENNIITKETINDDQQAQENVAKLLGDSADVTNTTTEKVSSDKTNEFYQIKKETMLNIHHKAAEEPELETTKEVKPTLEELEKIKAKEVQVSEETSQLSNLTSKIELEKKTLVADNMLSSPKTFSDETSVHEETENTLKDKLTNFEEEILQTQDKNQLNVFTKSNEDKLNNSASNILESSENLQMLDENDNIQFSEEKTKDDKTKNNENVKKISSPKKIQSTNTSIKVDSESTSAIEDNKTENPFSEQEDKSRKIDADNESTDKLKAELESQDEKNFENIKAEETNKKDTSSNEIIAEYKENKNLNQQNEVNLENKQLISDKTEVETYSEANKADKIIEEEKVMFGELEDNNQVDSDNIKLVEENIIGNDHLNSHRAINTIEKYKDSEDQGQETDSKCIKTTEENKINNHFIEPETKISENFKENEALESIDKAISENIQSNESSNNLESNIIGNDREDVENENPPHHLENQNNASCEIESTAIETPMGSDFKAIESCKEKEANENLHQESESDEKALSEKNQELNAAGATLASSAAEVVTDREEKHLESPEKTCPGNNETVKDTRTALNSTESEVFVIKEESKVNENLYKISDSQNKANSPGSSVSEVVTDREEKDLESPENNEKVKGTEIALNSLESDAVVVKEESQDKANSKKNQALNDVGATSVSDEKDLESPEKTCPGNNETALNSRNLCKISESQDKSNSEKNQALNEAEATSVSSAAEFVTDREEKESPEKTYPGNNETVKDTGKALNSSESEVVVVKEESKVNENSNKIADSEDKLNSKNNQSCKETESTSANLESEISHQERNEANSENKIIDIENQFNENSHKKSENSNKMSSENAQTFEEVKKSDIESIPSDKETKANTPPPISDTMGNAIDEKTKAIESTIQKSESHDKNDNENIPKLKKPSITALSLQSENPEKVGLEKIQSFEESRPSLGANSSGLMVEVAEENNEANSALPQQSETQHKNELENNDDFIESKIKTDSLIERITDDAATLISDKETDIIGEESKEHKISPQHSESSNDKLLETKDTIETNNILKIYDKPDNESNDREILESILKNFEDVESKQRTDNELSTETIAQAATSNKSPEENVSKTSNEEKNILKTSNEKENQSITSRKDEESTEKTSDESGVENPIEIISENKNFASNNSLVSSPFIEEKQVLSETATETSGSSNFDEGSQKKPTNENENSIKEKEAKDKIVNSLEESKIEMSEDSKLDIEHKNDSNSINSDSPLKLRNKNETDTEQVSQNGGINDEIENREIDQLKKHSDINQSSVDHSTESKDKIGNETNVEDNIESTLVQPIFLQKETNENTEVLVSQENKEKPDVDDEKIQNNELTEEYKDQNTKLEESPIRAEQKTTYEEKEETKDLALEEEKNVNIISEDKMEIQSAEELDKQNVSENLNSLQLTEAADFVNSIGNADKTVNENNVSKDSSHSKHKVITANNDSDLHKDHESSRYSSSVLVIGNQNAPKNIKNSKSDVNETIFDENNKIKDFQKSSLETEKSPSKHIQKASKTNQKTSNSVNMDDVSKQSKENQQIRHNVEQNQKQLPIAEIYLKSFKVMDNENVPNEAEAIISTADGTSKINENINLNSPAYSEATYRENDETEYTDSLEDKFERDSLEVGSSRDTDMDEDSLEIDQAQSGASSLKPYTEVERTATYLYGIHTPRESPIPPRKNQPKAIAYVIPFENESKKAIKESKEKTEKSEKEDKKYFSKNEINFENNNQTSNVNFSINKIDLKENDEVFESPKELLNDEDIEEIEIGESTPTENKLDTIFEQNEVESPRQQETEEISHKQNEESNKSQNIAVEKPILADTITPLKTETKELVEEIENCSENKNHSVAEVEKPIDYEGQRIDPSKTDSDNENFSIDEILKEKPITALTKEAIASNQKPEEERIDSPDVLSFLSDHDLSDSSTYTGTSSKEFDETVLMDEHFTSRHNIRQNPISLENNDDFPKGGIYEVDIKNLNKLNDNENGVASDLKGNVIVDPSSISSEIKSVSSNQEDVIKAELGKNIEDSVTDDQELKNEIALQKQPEEHNQDKLGYKEESEENLAELNKSSLNPDETKYEIVKETRKPVIVVEKSELEEPILYKDNSEKPKTEQKDFQTTADVEKLIESQILTESEISELDVKSNKRSSTDDNELDSKHLNQHLMLSEKAEEVLSNFEAEAEKKPQTKLDELLTKEETLDCKKLESENQKDQNIEVVDREIETHTLKELPIIPNENKTFEKQQVESLIENEMTKHLEEESVINKEKIVQSEREILKVLHSSDKENTNQEKFLIEKESFHKPSSEKEKPLNSDHKANVTTSILEPKNNELKQVQSKAEETVAESVYLSKIGSEILDVLNDKSKINQSEEVPTSKTENKYQFPNIENDAVTHISQEVKSSPLSKESYDTHVLKVPSTNEQMEVELSTTSDEFNSNFSEHKARNSAVETDGSTNDILSEINQEIPKELKFKKEIKTFDDEESQQILKRQSIKPDNQEVFSGSNLIDQPVDNKNQLKVSSSFAENVDSTEIQSETNNAKQIPEFKECIGTTFKALTETANKINEELSTNNDNVTHKPNMSTDSFNPINEALHRQKKISSAIIDGSKSSKTDYETHNMNVEKTALNKEAMKPEEKEGKEPITSSDLVAETEFFNQQEQSTTKEKSDGILYTKPKQETLQEPQKVFTTSLEESQISTIRSESPAKLDNEIKEDSDLEKTFVVSGKISNNEIRSSESNELTQNRTELVMKSLEESELKPQNRKNEEIDSNQSDKIVDNIVDQKNEENEEETVLSKIELRLQEENHEELIKRIGNESSISLQSFLENEKKTLQADIKELYSSENSTNGNHTSSSNNSLEDEIKASNISTDKVIKAQHTVLENDKTLKENGFVKNSIENATDDEKSGNSVIPIEAETAKSKQLIKNTKSNNLTSQETTEETNQNISDSENAINVQKDRLSTMENAVIMIQKAYKLYLKRQSTVLSNETTTDDSQIASENKTIKTNKVKSLQNATNENPFDLLVPENINVQHNNEENINKISWFVGNDPIFFDNDAKKSIDDAHSDGLDSQNVKLYEKSDKFSNQIIESDQALVDSTNNNGFETNEVDKNSLSIGETKSLFNQTNEEKVVSVKNDNDLSLETKENIELNGQLDKSEGFAENFTSQVEQPLTLSGDNEILQSKDDHNLNNIEEKENESEETQNNKELDYSKSIESTEAFLKSEIHYSTVITLMEIFETPCIKKCASVKEIDKLLENIEETKPKTEEVDLKESVISSVEKILQKPEEAIKKMQQRRSSETQIFENDENFSNQPSFDEPVIHTMETIVDSRNSSAKTTDDVVIINSSEKTENNEKPPNSEALNFSSTEDENDSEIMKTSNATLKRLHTIAGDDLKTISRSVTINETIKYVELTESDATTTSGGSFCLDEDTSENIRQKMMAYSLSEADSDFFEPHLNIVHDVSFEEPQDDFNINTVLESTESTSTETESTIVSAATKIQAGARGFLARRRLRRASAGTKSPVQYSYDTKDSFGNNAISESMETLIENEAAKKIQKAYRKHRVEQYPLMDRSNKNLGSSVPVTNIENSLAAKRLTLQRGDALRNNSSPEEDDSNNDARKNDVKIVMDNSSSRSTKQLSDERDSTVQQKLTKKNQDRDNELKWLAIRQNSMPVQIESEIFRVIPKNMRKKNNSAEAAKKRRQLNLKD